jgi:Zn-dependent protease
LDIQRILLTLPGIIIGFTIHEYSHAAAAYKLGDTSVKEDGRLTLDPFRHIDILGLIFIVIAGFGWAKPVRFYPDRLKNPKRDKAIIAAAGPFSNLLFGIILLFIIKGIWALNIYDEKYFDFANFVIDVLYYWSFANIGLFVFNMFPIPPLDGSHIFLSGLNLNHETETKIMHIGSAIFILIIIIQNTANIDILPIGNIVEKIITLILFGE